MALPSMFGDSDVNARVFGRPATRPGTTAAFPARSVGLIN